MIKITRMRKWLLAATGLVLSFGAFANTPGGLMQSGTDLNDQASLQRGAKLYMNYCSGCHSLQYMRYSRIAQDLGLSEQDVMANLNFTGAKFGDQIHGGMTPEMAKLAFGGKMPPDLSVISRVRGSDWIFTYLKSFYLDQARPVGWNNKLFPNASMPNVLWELQGTQHPKFISKVDSGKKDSKTNKAIMECPHGSAEIDEGCVSELVVAQPGRQDTKAFDQTVRDITAFLEYVGEPAALKRHGIGVWVLLFLALFSFFAWLLKNDYWSDVH